MVDSHACSADIFCCFMALCSYITLLGKVTLCGQSSDYPGQLECVTLKDCTKDVIGHLSVFGLSADEGLRTEVRLLLARAGKYLSIDLKCIVSIALCCL